MPVLRHWQNPHQREVILNSLLDLAVFLVVVLYGASDSWPAHFFRIVYFLRLADYSSLRRTRNWSVFNAELPRTRQDLSGERALTLFSAYRILQIVWLSAGCVAVACCLWAPVSSDQMQTRYDAAILIWALLILSVHLPKRMLLWRGLVTGLYSRSSASLSR